MTQSCGYLADVLAELDETEAALEQYEQAVRLEPDYEYAWGRLESMAYSLDRPTYRLEVAQKIAKQKPHEWFSKEIISKTHVPLISN